MIITVNNPEHYKILTTPSQGLDPLRYEEIFTKLEAELTRDPNGVGLSAVQLGLLYRAFVIDWEGQKYRFVNSSIDRKYGGGDFDIEGCLSIPGRQFRVFRPHKVTVTDDINGTQQYKGFLARIIQHEHDHTQGVTLLQSGFEIK